MNGAQHATQVLLSLPLWAKKFLAFMYRALSRPKGRNDPWAALIEVFHPKTVAEEHTQIAAREEFKAAWHQAWRDHSVDFVLTVPHALPPVPRGGTGTASLVSASYCFLFNIVSAAQLLVHTRELTARPDPARLLRRSCASDLCRPGARPAPRQLQAQP